MRENTNVPEAKKKKNFEEHCCGASSRDSGQIVTDVTFHIVQAQHHSLVIVVPLVLFPTQGPAHLVLHHLESRE